MSDPLTTVSSFLHDLSQGHDGLYDAPKKWFTSETIWENVGFATTVGVDEALALSAQMEKALGFNAIRVETLSIAAVGNVVLTERIDHMTAPDGEVLVPVRIMGAFEVDDDGKIVRWADYVDASAAQQMDAAAAARGAAVPRE